MHEWVVKQKQISTILTFYAVTQLYLVYIAVSSYCVHVSRIIKLYTCIFICWFLIATANKLLIYVLWLFQKVISCDICQKGNFLVSFFSISPHYLVLCSVSSPYTWFSTLSPCLVSLSISPYNWVCFISIFLVLYFSTAFQIFWIST